MALAQQLLSVVEVMALPLLKGMVVVLVPATTWLPLRLLPASVRRDERPRLPTPSTLEAQVAMALLVPAFMALHSREVVLLVAAMVLHSREAVIRVAAMVLRSKAVAGVVGSPLVLASAVAGWEVRSHSSRSGAAKGQLSNQD